MGGSSQGPGSQHCLWNRFAFTWHQKRVECCWTATTPEVTFERGAAMWCWLWVISFLYVLPLQFSAACCGVHIPTVNIVKFRRDTTWNAFELWRPTFECWCCGFQRVGLNTTSVHLWYNNNHFPSAALNSVACCCFRWLNTETTVTTQSHYSPLSGRRSASLLHSLIYEETLQLLVHSQQRNIVLWFHSSEAEIHYSIC